MVATTLITGCLQDRSTSHPMICPHMIGADCTTGRRAGRKEGRKGTGDGATGAKGTGDGGRRRGNPGSICSALLPANGYWLPTGHSGEHQSCLAFLRNLQPSREGTSKQCTFRALNTGCPQPIPSQPIPSHPIPSLLVSRYQLGRPKKQGSQQRQGEMDLQRLIGLGLPRTGSGRGRRRLCTVL